MHGHAVCSFEIFASNWWEHFRKDCAPILSSSDSNPDIETTHKDMFRIREFVRCMCTCHVQVACSTMHAARTLQARHSNSTVTARCAELLHGAGGVGAQNSTFSNVIQVLNTILTAVFAMECFFKILGLGLYLWATVPLNVLDAIVVILSLVAR